MSFCLYGVGVSRGIAIGYAHLISHTSLEIAHYEIPAARVDAEVRRLDAAVDTVRAELEGLAKSVPVESATSSMAPEFAAFINLHLMILSDPMLAEVPRELIARQRCNAEWALKQQMDSVLEEFERIEDGYLRERGADVTQVVERVLKALLGQPVTMPQPRGRAEHTILVARDLSPADVIVFRHQAFAAFITDLGGATSHTAILARSMNIPSVVALHHAWDLVRENEPIIVDGTQGAVIVNPDKAVLAEYRLRQEQWDIERQRLRRLRTTKAQTLDGVDVALQANIESPDEVDEVRQAGAAGIGLYRSEFLFLGREDLPSEEEQFAAYRRVAEALKPHPVTIRTLDLGADKALGTQVAGPNPALGLRAIRYCLAEPQLFMTQLRAILRASKFGKVHILLPMLSNLTELRQSLDMIEAARQQLREESVAFDEHVPIGGMIEVPAAALALPAFVKELDFLSIGTNDLIQYTLAIDRTDDSVAYLYNPLHPAVLWLLAHVIRTANKAKIPVAVCGEMAGDASLTRLLLGFGLRQFSMHSAQLPAVKQRVLQTSLSHAESLAKRILSAHEPDKVQLLLERLNG